jgi:hypothetical protein
MTDATDRKLTACMEVTGSNRIEVRVDDLGAAYPVRIDPTFSDADWIEMGRVLEVNGRIHAVTVDGGGNLLIGGGFTKVGGVEANYIARWDGGAWHALDSGMDAQVLALVVSGTNLYAAGSFTTAGGASANRIAVWDGSAWSALDSGMDGDVYSLAVSETDLYAGGIFTTAGGVNANRIAKWDGSAWSALDLGFQGWNDSVKALAVSGTDLYVGGIDWQVSQPDLVGALFDNANGAGLYTPEQVQALNVGTPLLQRGPVTGAFTLTIGVQKSSDLQDFFPFPMSEPQTSINGDGKLEFEFTVPDDAAFFRLEAN